MTCCLPTSPRAWWQLLSSAGAGCGGSELRVCWSPSVTHPAVGSPSPLCCWCELPGALSWPSGERHGLGCPHWPAGAASLQSPTRRGLCGLSGPPNLLLVVALPPSWWHHRRKKEEIYLFSVHRDPVLLWVRSCTSAASPHSVGRTPPMVVLVGQPEEVHEASACFGVRWRNVLAADLTTSALSEWPVPHRNGCGSFGPGSGWGFHSQTGMNCASVRIFFSKY